MDVAARARSFAALADPHRLAMVDALALSDLTALEVADAAGVPMNLAAHHLGVLADAGLIGRRVSEGDRRRRYIVLRREALHGLLEQCIEPIPSGLVLFVCTQNSARSQFAAALWRQQTGRAAASAGREPSPRVHPLAVQAAARVGVNLRGAVPRGYAAVAERPLLVVSVCDRAREAGLPFDAPAAHWSIPDPVAVGRPAAFTAAFAEIAARIDDLAARTAA
jgi:protein-tyrosine-phosphatase/DNA-binding transcriptional ArsR family regulator